MPRSALTAVSRAHHIRHQVEARTDKKIETATAAEIIARANRITAALGG